MVVWMKEAAQETEWYTVKVASVRLANIVDVT